MKKSVIAGVVVVGVVLVVVAAVRAGGMGSQEGVVEGAPFRDLIGEYVRVEFRDTSALADLRTRTVSRGMVARINDVAVGAEGKLMEVREGWIRLSHGQDQDIWVPLDVVLVIENAMSIAEMMEIQRKVDEGAGR